MVPGWCGVCHPGDHRDRLSDDGCGVGAIGDGSPLMVLLHPGIPRCDVEGDRVAQARNLVVQRVNGSVSQGVEQGAVEGAHCVAEPVIARQGLLSITTVGWMGITDEGKAECENQKRMAKHRAAQVGSGAHAFPDADEDGVERRRLWVSRSPPGGTRRLPRVDDGAFEQRKEGAVMGHQGILIEQGGQRRRVKEGRGRSQNRGLLV